MADESHVFIIRQEQIRTEKGTRTACTKTIILYSLLLILILSFKVVELSAVFDNFSVQITSPKIESSSAFAIVGKVFVIKCYVNLTDSVTVKWHFPLKYNKTYLHYTSRAINYEQTTLSNTLILLFYSKIDHDFSLRCSCRSKIHPRFIKIANYNIKIYYKPILVGVSYNWQFGIGGEAELFCHIDSKPEATVNWYQDDKNISTDEVNRIHFKRLRSSNFTNNITYVLNINGIIYVDYVNYKCVAQNKYGKVEGVIIIPKNFGRINDTCLGNDDCFIENSFCNSQNICKCHFGYYHFSKKNQIEKCARAGRITDFCSSDDDCVEKFSKCEIQSKTCQCLPNYTAIHITEWNFPKCLPTRSNLFSYCNYDKQCQTSGSKCIDYLCLCDDYHKHYWNKTSQTDSCIEKTFLFSHCSGNLCELGGFAYSRCVFNVCQCIDGYHYDQRTHHCEGGDATIFFISIMIVSILLLLYLTP